jgi:hypothetical protein
MARREHDTELVIECFHDRLMRLPMRNRGVDNPSTQIPAAAFGAGRVFLGCAGEPTGLAAIPFGLVPGDPPLDAAPERFQIDYQLLVLGE